jgi:hypothetical protein
LLSRPDNRRNGPSQPRHPLQTLGERESGTARLEEAVAPYRAALENCENAGIKPYIEIARTSLFDAEQLVAERLIIP